MARTPKFQRCASWQFEDWWEARRFSKWAELIATGWYDSPDDVGSIIYQFLGKRRHALALYHADQRYHHDETHWAKHAHPNYSGWKDTSPLHRAYSAKRKRRK